MSNEIETQETQETKSKGGRPKNPPAPTNSAEVRSLMANEVVRAAPDKDRLRFLGELLVSFEGVEARAETAASKLLPAVTTERDTLLARVNELQPLAEQLPTVAQELADLRANFDSKILEARKELIEDAQQCQWAAERARNEATEKLREADNTVAASGWKELRATLADVIARHGIPQPDFWETSATMPSAFWELWGWSPAKAKVYTSYKSGFKEPSPAFKAQLLRHLKAMLPLQTFIGMEPPAPISDLSEKIACMTEQAQRWNVWTDIDREFTQIQVERQAEALRTHYAAMRSEEQASALRGEGRTSIVPEEPASITGCPPGEPHLLGCVCSICQPGLRQRSSLDVIEEEKF
jgi:hypothetical protein